MQSLMQSSQVFAWQFCPGLVREGHDKLMQDTTSQLQTGTFSLPWVAKMPSKCIKHERHVSSKSFGHSHSIAFRLAKDSIGGWIAGLRVELSGNIARKGRLQSI